MKEKFLSDLRKAREVWSGDELFNELNKLRRRLDDPSIITGDIVHALLLSYRDLQQYDAMVKMIDELEQQPSINLLSTPAILSVYAFALSRRNMAGDRERALKAATTGLESDTKFHIPDLLCLCGRIYKDMFTDSDCADIASRDLAIQWYRKAFDVHQSEYAGINLATLLVVAGNDFKSSDELKRIAIALNRLIGQKIGG